MAGTFYAREPVSVLYSFVREALRDDWLPFELLGPGGLKVTDENLAFNECGLVSKSQHLARGPSRDNRTPEPALSGSALAHNLGFVLRFQDSHALALSF